jgi:hypothetical protein
MARAIALLLATGFVFTALGHDPADVAARAWTAATTGSTP